MTSTGGNAKTFGWMECTVSHYGGGDSNAGALLPYSVDTK